MREFAAGIEKGYPDVHLMVLLIDERPEEATDWRRSVKRGQVFVSTADETSKHHIQVAEAVWKRCMRLVEMGEDVILLLDSITRLARAYNNNAGPGKTMSGGLDSRAMERPRKIFGSARNTVEAGSLTILGTPSWNGQPPEPAGLRGVQGHRQRGARAQPQALGPPDLPGHRHREVGHPEGGAGGPEAPEADPHPAPRARSHALRRGGGLPVGSWTWRRPRTSWTGSPSTPRPDPVVRDEGRRSAPRRTGGGPGAVPPAPTPSLRRP